MGKKSKKGRLKASVKTLMAMKTIPRDLDAEAAAVGAADTKPAAMAAPEEEHPVIAPVAEEPAPENAAPAAEPPENTVGDPCADRPGFQAEEQEADEEATRAAEEQRKAIAAEAAVQLQLQNERTGEKARME